jgi:acyl carrier protein
VSDAEAILEFIRDELFDEDVDIDEDTSLFRAQLLDSMNLTTLIAFLEQTFAIRIGAMDIVYENLDTVRHMLSFIERKRAAQPA